MRGFSQNIFYVAFRHSESGGVLTVAYHLDSIPEILIEGIGHFRGALSDYQGGIERGNICSSELGALEPTH